MELGCLFSFPVPSALQMFLLTFFILVIGCDMSQTADAEDREAAMTSKDALKFPVMAGGLLVGLYLLFKYLDAGLINSLLRIYFAAAGAGACAFVALSVLKFIVDDEYSYFEIPLHWVKLAERGVKVTRARVVSLCLGSCAAYWWWATDHWLASNVLGVAFSLVGLASMNVGSVATGCLFLIALFFYDIFMVFGTGYLMGPHKVSIMEEVATKVEGPIKLLFLLPPDEARGRSKPFGMLGLGDIIVPGIFLAILKRFDASNSGTLPNAPTPYFNAGIIAYALGLVATNIAMYTMDSAQPALLYLCPFVLVFPSLLALAKGEFSKFLSYSEEERDSKEKKS